MVKPSLLLLLTGTAEAVSQMPKFSWDTLPVFYHGANVTGMYSDEALQVLAKYPLVTIEKYQGPLAWSESFAAGTSWEEDNIAAVAKAIKHVNPDTAVLMYMHQWNYPWYSYRWDLERRPEWWATDPSTGDTMTMTVPEVNCSFSTTLKPPGCPKQTVPIRNWNDSSAVMGWANACARMVNAGLDGCFVDGVCDPSCNAPIFGSGLATGLELMQRNVEPGLVIANGAYHGDYFPKAKGAMIEQFHATGKTGFFWVETLAAAAQKGIVMVVHAGTCPPTEDDLAGFLVAAEEYSYFGCGPWYEPAGGGPAWYDEYDRPLGAPQGPAEIVNRVWTRRFASGTTVVMDINAQKGTITWADESPTV